MLRRVSILLLLLVTAPVHGGGVEGVQPVVRQIAFGDRRIEVDRKVADAIALDLAKDLQTRKIALTAVWRIPGMPKALLAIVIQPPVGREYGPQLAVLGGASDPAALVFLSRRLYDADFVNPTFFVFHGRTLLLADQGSEDAYGIIAWSFEGDKTRDLGEIEVALPEDQDVFTRGAAVTARASLKDGRYLVSIPGPVLLDPRRETERVLAKAGERVVFCEAAGVFRQCPGKDHG